jgi:hypothetical protein
VAVLLASSVSFLVSHVRGHFYLCSVPVSHVACCSTASSNLARRSQSQPLHAGWCAPLHRPSIQGLTLDPPVTEKKLGDVRVERSRNQTDLFMSSHIPFMANVNFCIVAVKTVKTSKCHSLSTRTPKVNKPSFTRPHSAFDERPIRVPATSDSQERPPASPQPISTQKAKPAALQSNPHRNAHQQQASNCDSSANNRRSHSVQATHLSKVRVKKELGGRPDQLMRSKPSQQGSQNSFARDDPNPKP